jgi:NADPH:quinone reductase-like Zn-dependent oxidoreductase
MRSVLSHVRLVPPLIVFVQFLDYTKEPLEKALSKNPPSPKFDAIFDAVGLLSPALFTHSAAYLAPTGVYVSAGSAPDKSDLKGIATMAKLVWATLLRPKFLGGTPRRYAFYGLSISRERIEAVDTLVAEGLSVFICAFS